jgi:outer membrane protein OmpA-like peptidoglycan-associated protein
MLDDLELPQVQQIDTDEQRALVEHKPPGMAGSLFQDLGRSSTYFSLWGVATGPEALEFVEELDGLFRAGEPVPFVADITTATEVDEVLIKDLGVRELAGKPERYEYALNLCEYIPPPEPEEEPPEPEPPEPSLDTATLEVTVIVEGQPGFDYSTVTVTLEGTQEDGTTLNRTLTNRSENVWTEEEMPPGTYTVRAVVTEPEAMSGSAPATVRAGETERVTITLRAGQVIAKAFVIHFWFDKAFIEPCLRAVMRQVAEYVQNHPDEKLVIVGHTDLVGSDDYNQSLSERRARSAYAFLTFGRDRATALAEWNHLRQRRPAGEQPSIKDTWGTREYQYMLQDVGYYVGNIDEQHGPATDEAIRNFQQDQGLPTTGAMDDATWEKLIELYLSQDNLAVPESQFFANCEGEILKWLGCREQDPVRNTQDAWRPNRRTEFLFVRAEGIPCQVPRPVTFDLPTPGAVGSNWCLGPGDANRRCCFTTRATAQEGRWLIQPAQPERVLVSGTITYEDGTPVANAQYALIAPNGEYLHTDESGNADLGERPQGESRGRPIPDRADANGRFSYPNPTPVGTYILELLNLQSPQVARNRDREPQTARSNVVCFQLNGAST